MNELIPDKQTYQTNKRRMAWSALGMMIISTIAALIDPMRLSLLMLIVVRFYIKNSLTICCYKCRSILHKYRNTRHSTKLHIFSEDA